jgi:hypothetical protein
MGPGPQNKNKPKKGVLPFQMVESGQYHSSLTTDDVWICYPWEAKYADVISLGACSMLTDRTGISTSTTLWPTSVLSHE